MGRVFSGIQATGNIHLGNYLGAIRNWVKLQDAHENFFCIVDLHSLTTLPNPQDMKTWTREVAAAYIASGIDPEKSVVFVQSAVPAHSELAWIFNCLTPLGWLNRMTQFKEKAGKHREQANLGLYAYPVLMAADILLYKATHVPVGEDQKQHLELARDIAGAFNRQYGQDYFELPVLAQRYDWFRYVLLGTIGRILRRQGIQNLHSKKYSSRRSAQQWLTRANLRQILSRRPGLSCPCGRTDQKREKVTAWR